MIRVSESSQHTYNLKDDGLLPWKLLAHLRMGFFLRRLIS
ncbi:hypothetical protein yberc0001_4680 [Yersinia bercovieri ATCC 43970]|uniref:Uncharacterized protein n=1 Tax=Yersinia bercovieri ATCC 43970 TaxID=349968 RepID=A0ABP2DZ72_YERBE|nr:hypothetical protein yberc0001_4680 [Yersinia bercovieri ATCC 43970]